MTSISITGAKKEALECVTYIYYQVLFKKNKAQVQALINLGSEVNATHLIFAKQLGLSIRPTDFGVQKIDNITLNTYEMMLAVLLVKNRANQLKFFEEIFLVASVSPEVVFRILFLILSGANVDFSGWELQWRTYTTKKTVPTIRRVELVGKKKFAATTLIPEHKTYIVYVKLVNFNASPSFSPLDVHPFRRPQIFDLIGKEAPTKVLAKYLNFADVWFSDLTSKLPKHTRINDNAINPVNSQQPPYGPIYSLKPVKLKIMKAYIEINLANGFNRPSKSPANALILFDQKLNSFLQLCINYWGLNNL